MYNMEHVANDIIYYGVANINIPNIYGSVYTLSLRSSIGRAEVSKTSGWGFESLRRP